VTFDCRSKGNASGDIKREMRCFGLLIVNARRILANKAID
jgi:hypothetical protein